MPEFLIAFNNEWVPDLTIDDLRAAARRTRVLDAEMADAGVLIFSGGLGDADPVMCVDPAGNTPVFSDGPFVETKEHLGGVTIVDVADEEAARLWAAKVALACGWPQEVRRFQVPMSG